MSAEKRRTALIFAHECAPYNRPESTIGAQRPAQFAKWLPEFGWRTIVICCDAARRRVAHRSDLAAIRAEAESRLAVAGADESIVVPTTSLIADGVLDALAESFYSGRASRLPGARLLRKPLTAFKLVTGDYSQSWQPCARITAEVVQQRLSIDIVLGAHSPDAGLHLACWFSRQYGVPWVADFRDPVLMPFDAVGRRLYGRVARRLLASAAATVNVTPGWAQLDRKLFGRPSFMIRNGFDEDDFREPAPPRVPGPLRIVYTGQVWRPFQRLEVFLSGLRLFQSNCGARQRSIEFAYVGPHEQMVAGLAEEAGVQSAVAISGRVSRPQAMYLQRSSDVALVVGLTPDKAIDWSMTGFIPGKVYEYLGARLPILLAPSDHADLHALLREAGGVTVADTPEDVARVLTDMVAVASISPDGGPPKATRNLRPYTRREGARRLATLMNAVVAGRNLDAMAATGDTLGGREIA